MQWTSVIGFTCGKSKDYVVKSFQLQLSHFASIRIGTSIICH